MPITRSLSTAISDGASSGMFKNRIINGGMDIWQRGTSTTSLSVYLADRWITYATTSLTTSQSSDAPSGFKYSLSMAGSAYPQAYHRIESRNCYDLVGQTVTISFWAKQTVGAGTGTVGVLLYYPTVVDNFTTVNPSAVQTFNGSSSWTYYTATFTNLPASVANGLMVMIYANVNGSSSLLFTGVQLEAGTTATNFERRSYQAELDLCYRYCQTLKQGIGVWINSTSCQLNIPYIKPMRATPTVSQTNTITVTDYVAVDLTQSSTSLSITNNNDQYGTTISLGNFSGATGGRVAGIRNYSGTGVILLSAEL